ncbi:SDR family NAD(P)-dependent oxidoreductase [Jatrophihabitans sp.]|uniref:SDR family NAD(P)-dependent oxidoreductase n=1 Tax=Jatrophihabitans sp. TaxID=1932789 RepID=UPI0030C6CF12|nr:Short chain dehydrogenase/reductase family oxidoreductase [Jatrophihabitans sp.]
MSLPLIGHRGRRTRDTHAVVTGAGSGIGRAFAVELAARGGRVVVSDISPGRAKETEVLIRNAGGKALAVECDVTLIEGVEALAATADDWFGQSPNLVINNAGVGAGGTPVGETPLEDWQWVLGVNLWGVVHGCHVFTPKLRELSAAGKSAGIINVASAASFAAGPGMAAYNVSKAGVLALSETLAAELAGTKVGVTVLCPTFVKTAITEDGRISGRSVGLAETLMRWTGRSADSVARTTLDAHDRGQLYVLPQLDARAVWQAKRLSPTAYTRFAGLVNRVTS